MIYFIAVLLLMAALLGAPLFTVIGGIAMAGFYLSDVELTVVSIEIYRLVDTPVLVALPLFTVAGFLLGESGTSARLVRLVRAWLGWMHGGMALVAFVACALFTAFTGASGVTIVALGALLYPALIQAGYKEQFSLGLVTTSGSLGLLLPPSLPLIIYGIVAQQIDAGRGITIEKLFLAGIFPALLMIIALGAWSVWSNRNNSTPLTPFSWKDARISFLESAWELPLPFFLIAGIYGGYFAISEAAAVTAIYVLFVETVIHKEISFTDLPVILRDSMVMVGGILLILGMSLALTNYMIDAAIPERLFKVIGTYVSSKIMFLVLLNLFLLALGMLLDIFSAIVVIVPLILPIAVSYGIHPVHLGIIFLANMQIGYFTPPVGMNLFIASYRFGKPILEVCRSTFPFLLILLVVVLMITYIPYMSLVLIE